MRGVCLWRVIPVGGHRGANSDDADRAATLVVAAAEGTVAMCRAKRSIEPLDRIGGQLELAIKAVIAAR